MNPYFFKNHSGRLLFGAYYEPAGSVSREAGVVLCYPLGHEYLRSHWVFRKLSDLLADAGFHVLRFDYAGTGDSEGDEQVLTLEGMASDIRDAAGELRELSGVREISLAGLRLGASLAALASDGMRKAVLWDPILQGRDYLSELKRMHREYLVRAPGSETSPGPDAALTEMLGFAYPERLQRELAELSLVEKLGNSADNLIQIVSDEPTRWDSSAHYDQALLLNSTLNALRNALL